MGAYIYDLYDPHEDISYQIPQLWVEDDPGARDASVHYLDEFQVGDKLVLYYDYGDDWEFDIQIEKISRTKQGPVVARVLAGQRYGIIDDIGGVSGLKEYYSKCKKKQNLRFYEEWLGFLPNLDEFNVADINRELNE
ncbi:hypothetical protein GTO87_09095 [Ligilactobacillus saerimneri]|uniref:Plasmid pRiA4b Orf3-like domain-containing protein n=1 Tax=Ligilactobacillus saerimneri TaxID=228229 RepID=A0A7H9EM01_9LACO|nr:hypothetical protein [Ligilactobacillus saerimneri]QLL78726.1 hypothetical protein GTO87_09095 [Ligilactobacillus saerimneri]